MRSRDRPGATETRERCDPTLAASAGQRKTETELGSGTGRIPHGSALASR